MVLNAKLLCPVKWSILYLPWHPCLWYAWRYCPFALFQLNESCKAIACLADSVPLLLPYMLVFGIVCGKEEGDWKTVFLLRKVIYFVSSFQLTPSISAHRRVHFLSTYFQRWSRRLKWKRKDPVFVMDHSLCGIGVDKAIVEFCYFMRALERFYRFATFDTHMFVLRAVTECSTEDYSQTWRNIKSVRFICINLSRSRKFKAKWRCHSSQVNDTRLTNNLQTNLKSCQIFQFG